MVQNKKGETNSQLDKSNDTLCDAQYSKELLMWNFYSLVAQRTRSMDQGIQRFHFQYFFAKTI